MKTIDADEIGKVAVIGGKPLTDKKLLAEIRRLQRNCASFGSAMLRAAYITEAQRRGLEIPKR